MYAKFQSIAALLHVKRLVNLFMAHRTLTMIAFHLWLFLHIRSHKIMLHLYSLKIVKVLTLLGLYQDVFVTQA